MPDGEVSDRFELGQRIGHDHAERLAGRNDPIVGPDGNAQFPGKAVHRIDQEHVACHAQRGPIAARSQQDGRVAQRIAVGVRGGQGDGHGVFGVRHDLAADRRQDRGRIGHRNADVLTDRRHPIGGGDRDPQRAKETIRRIDQ